MWFKEYMRDKIRDRTPGTLDKSPAANRYLTVQNTASLRSSSVAHYRGIGAKGSRCPPHGYYKSGVAAISTVSWKTANITT